MVNIMLAQIAFCITLYTSVRPQVGRYVRRVGRPRQDWTTQVMREGARLLGAVQLESLLGDRSPGAEKRRREKRGERRKEGGRNATDFSVESASPRPPGK